MVYDLIICEKDQQATDIANALGVPQNTMYIHLPPKAFYDNDSKIETKKKRIYNKTLKIDSERERITALGKDPDEQKGFLKLLLQKGKWEKELIKLTKEKEDKLKTANKKAVKYFANDDIVIVACSGHLIGLKQKTGTGIKYLNFETEYNIPSSYSDDDNTQKMYARLKVIEHFLDETKISRIICATDYDREGESIFGYIMEYYDVDLSKCLRMKFSTLETDVLRNAYNNLISFNIDLFNAGKMRRWADFVIGYVLNPYLGKLYREKITPYLIEDCEIPEEIVKKYQLIYGQTYNIGRVKLVILDHIYSYTKDQLKKVAKVENQDMKIKDKEIYQFWYQDNDSRDHYLFDNEFIEKNNKWDKLDLDEEINLEVINIEFEEVRDVKAIRDWLEIPNLLNLTNVFQICSDLGASTEEINRVLEFLYLQKYISYPRSQSERWEIPDPNARMAYAQSVLTALERMGFPIKDYYKKTEGNEGILSHSHPAIHPLPSLTKEKIERLKKISPLGFLVFNRIAVHTLKCFEKEPKIKKQKIHFKMTQDNGFEIGFYKTYNIEVIDEAILSFEGIWNENTIIPEINVSVGDSFSITIDKIMKTDLRISSNHEEAELLNDFDVINFLNTNQIGTDATRPVLLSSLIELKYFVSPNILLTTFLGNTLSKIANRYVSFIDIDYTLQFEKDLNDIEEGKLPISEFKNAIKNQITQTFNNIKNNKEEVKELLFNMPHCEVHDIPLIIKAGKFGKFMQCPFFYLDDVECDQSISI